MKNLIGLTGVGIMLTLLAISAGEPAVKGSASPDNPVTLTII